MSFAFLAAPTRSTQPTRPSREPLPVLRLESLDGTRQIVLDGRRRNGWTRLPGATGLEMPPLDVIRSPIPGVAGTSVDDVRVEERPIFIPIHCASPNSQQVTHLAMMDTLRSIVDPLTGQFRLVGVTVRGERELVCVYTGGLEGADGRDEAGLYWRKIGLTAVACQPFAQARTDRLVEFQVAAGGGGFLGVAGGTDAPWPRALSSSSVIGDNMRVAVASEVPVYPTIELVGPMDSFSGTVQLEDATLPPYFGGAPWSVEIPDGVPAGSTLRMVTHPRARSTRLDGLRAAGRVARGSTLRPFYPGVNVMDVSAPGGNEQTRVRIRWREQFRSLW